VNMKDKEKIAACLDEIEIAQIILYKKLTSSKVKASCRGWILRQKTILKELGYTGKMPRKKRVTKEKEIA